MTAKQVPEVNILVMEPEALSSQYAIQAAQRLHLEPHVITALSMNDAQALRNRFHLVILGFDRDQVENFARLDQARKNWSSAVIMGICPRITSTDRIALLNAGVDFLIEKPFFVEECASAIQAVLRRLEPHLRSEMPDHFIASIAHEKP